jgi:transcriptional regulator with XRE-family HTH domain
MDQARVGRSLRVIRRAQGLRQVDVARGAGCSQGLVSLVERGHGASLSVAALCRIFAAVGAGLDCVVRYRGADLDRLLDERHAATAMTLATYLRDLGWRVAAEVTFNHYGDRGSIDLLGFHPPTRSALVVEVKTELASAEETLRRLDVKVRLAPSPTEARFGERPARVARLLAVLDSTANRNRVSRLGPLLEAALPLRSAAMRQWLRDPGPAIGGVLFVAMARDTSPHASMRGTRRVRIIAGAPVVLPVQGTAQIEPTGRSKQPLDRRYQHRG